MSTLTRSNFEKIVFNVEDCDLNNLVENFVAKAYLSSDIKTYEKKFSYHMSRHNKFLCFTCLL